MADVSVSEGLPAPDAQSAQHATFEEELENLACRFIVNLPANELTSIERIGFQVELAYNPNLPQRAQRKFTEELLQVAARAVPLIQLYTSSGPSSLNNAYSQFIEYKTRVPVCGAIILSEDWTRCLLVKGWGKGASWTFPKGKINQDEPKRDCAVREVREETGFDASKWLPEDSKDYFELTQREQRIRLYVIPGVPSDTPFATQTRREISRIEWFKLSDLPTAKKPKTPSAERGGKFYMVMPFVMRLRRWIQANKRTHPRRPATPTPKDDRIQVDELFAAAPTPNRNATPGLISLPPAALRQMAAHKASTAEPRVPKEQAPPPLQPLPAPPSNADTQPRMDGTAALRALLGLQEPAPTAPMPRAPAPDQTRHTLLSILNASAPQAPRAAPEVPQPQALPLSPETPSPMHHPVPSVASQPLAPSAAEAHRAQLMTSLLGPSRPPPAQASPWPQPAEQPQRPPAPPSLLTTLLGPVAASPVAPPAHASPTSPPVVPQHANPGTQNLLSILNGPPPQSPPSARPDASNALLATLLHGQGK
ncbi:5'-(N(7)-methylguanosine 5'-triphospho)-[mRNA] hydrolase [Malassezia caprae]|uniref:5'-(N(7)-methylguanosine 5'-triphospho)-[mRNA] hydrolase n=1 Tax=Malassezia caprae TaxID=1381934 RepID=A0AAF0E8Y5_9BASI|nr:5'-(N(7)-methylguanosine 5'-triphospho)-[mRNA] hydrolase [Malassezia caprae]